MSNVGKWDHWYAGLVEPAAYGDTATYQMCADWLADCATVEDWGCGKGWARRFFGAGRYVGVDGSRTPYADVIADLADYRSDVDGVMMRHVLEHDDSWPRILANASTSARLRLAIVLFTPLAERTRRIAWTPTVGVPDIGFRLGDLIGPLEADGWTVDVETLATNTQYGTETILRCKR